MEIHESLLNNNPYRMYLGTVDSVSKVEMPDLKDAVGNKLNSFEILFNVGDLISKAKAIPLEVHSEVEVGDKVIIFSMESIYNNTYYYHPIRFISENNDTVFMKYGDTILELIPKDKSNTDLLLADGKNIIVISPKSERINIKSGYGGIQIDSSDGNIDIKNDDFQLSELIKELIDALIKLKVEPNTGMLLPDTSAKFLKLKTQFSQLLGDVKKTEYYPYVPDDTYTTEFAAQVVADTGIYILSDEGHIVEDPRIKKLMTDLPADAEQDTVVDAQVDESPIGDLTVDDSPCDLPQNINVDTQLSPNFTLASVTTLPTFPHNLKAQHGLSKQQIACNLKVVANNVLEPILAKYPNMQINSGFRSSTGGSSQHERGQAVDLQFPGFTSQEYLEASKWVRANIPFDQFIFEHGNSIWFHISCKVEKNRGALLTMLKGNYEQGIKLYYT